MGLIFYYLYLVTRSTLLLKRIWVFLRINLLWQIFQGHLTEYITASVKVLICIKAVRDRDIFC
eukprot:UN16950